MTSSFDAIGRESVPEKFLQVVGTCKFSFDAALWSYFLLPRDNELMF